MMADAFDASVGVDDIDGVTFGDGFGGALGQASAARDAIFLNFHCHGIRSLRELGFLCLYLRDEGVSNDKSLFIHVHLSLNYSGWLLAQQGSQVFFHHNLDIKRRFGASPRPGAEFLFGLR